MFNLQNNAIKYNLDEFFDKNNEFLSKDTYLEIQNFIKSLDKVYYLIENHVSGNNSKKNELKNIRNSFKPRQF